MMKKLSLLSIFTLLVVMTVFLSACNVKYVPENLNNSAFDVVDDLSNGRNKIMFDESDGLDTQTDESRDLIKYADEDIDESDISLTINAIEGELIDIQPKAVDPDEDTIVYDFTGPFNSAGLWQTQDGDEGRYLITVSASDGDLTTKEYVLVIIDPRNKAPILECPDKITVFETDTIKLNCNVYDLEEDIYSVVFSGWMDLDEYVTTYDDAGQYSVLVTAEDNLNNVMQQTIQIVVKDKNRFPIVSNVVDIYATETDVIILNISAYDPDGDEVEIEFSDPFDKYGIWTTEDGDDGVYDTYIKASDGKDSITKRFKVYIDNVNTRPTLELDDMIVVNETDTIKINVEVSDAENDPLTITFSGWMDSDEYVTTYDDAGIHYVKVTVSDGRLETSDNIEVVVNNINRPPVFVIPG